MTQGAIAIADILMSVSAYEPKKSHPLLPRFCPCQDCPYYQKLENYITLGGTYPVNSSSRRRQRFYCHLGKHRFSATAYSGLFGYHGSFKEYIQTAKMSTYGLSTEQIADVLERDGRTILEWQKA